MKKFIIALAILITAFVGENRLNEYSKQQDLLRQQRQELSQEQNYLRFNAVLDAINSYESKFQALERKTGHDFLVFRLGQDATPDVLRFRLQGSESYNSIKRSLSAAARLLSETAVKLDRLEEGTFLPEVHQEAQRPLSVIQRDQADKLYAAMTLNIDKRWENIDKMTYLDLK